MGLSKENRFILFWAALSGMATLIIWFLPWRFQVNDDEVMMWLVSGAYTGQQEWFAVFLHPILSWTFSKSYYLLPSIPWYPLAWFLILYLSFLAFIKLVFKGSQPLSLKNLWILFAFAFLVHFLFFLQFSMVAAFALTVALSVRLSRDMNSPFAIFPEDFLLLIGFLVRPEILILFLVGILILKGVFFRDKSVLKKLTFPLILWAVGLVITWICLNSNDLQRFHRLNQLRSQVFDHPALQLHKDDIKQIHPELYNFSNGLIDFQSHPELSEKLPQWKEFLDSKRTELLSLDSVFKALSTFVFHEHFLLGLMGLFLAFAVCWNWRKAGLIFLMLSGVLILATPFYLIKVQIYGIISLFFFMNIFLAEPHVKMGKYFNWTFILLLLVGIGFHFYSFIQSPKNLISADKLSVEIKNLSKAGQIYLIGKGENYRDLLFENPLPFKILGWPTLLESQIGVEKSTKNIYFVDSATYFNNIYYFDNQVRLDSQTSLILLIQK